MKDLKKRSALFIIIAGCFWGMIGLFSGGLAALDFTSPEITLIRNAVAAAGMFLYLLFFKKDSLRICIRDIWMFLGTGILSIVFFNVMYFITIELTTLSVAAILLYTAPCFVTVMSVLLFHEKMTGRKLAALFLAFLGCTFTTGILDQLITGSSVIHVTRLGILTGIASGFGYALYSIFGNLALKKYKSETVTFYTFLIAACFLLPFCLRPVFLQKFTCFGAAANALAIGLISTLCPFIFYTEGLKHTEPGRASIMAFIEPMVATLISILIFKQPLSFTGVLGILLIFGSIVILNLQ